MRISVCNIYLESTAIAELPYMHKCRPTEQAIGKECVRIGLTVKMVIKLFRAGIFTILTMLLFCVLSPKTFALSKAAPPPSDKMHITSLEILEDSDGSYDFAGIISGAFAGRFQRYDESIISLGITKSVYWVRFRLPEIVDSDDRLLLQLNNYNIDKIDLYMPVGGSGDGSGCGI